MGLTFRLGQIPLAIQTDTSNNVGIGGAANASFKLQVTGTTNLTGALTGTTGTFSSGLGIATTPLAGNLSISTSAFSNAGTKSYTADNVGGISAYVSSQDPYRGYLDIYSTRSGDGSTLGGSIIRFLTSSVSASVNAIERMVITQSGNVGIGTNSGNVIGFSGPMLTIAGTGQGQGIEIWRNSNTIPDGEDIGLITFLAGTSPFQVARIVGKAVGTSENAGSLSFQTSESAGVIERMRITSSGWSKFSNTGTYSSPNGTFHQFNSDDVDDVTLQVYASSTSKTGNVLESVCARAASNAYSLFACYSGSSTLQFFIRGDGLIVGSGLISSHTTSSGANLYADPANGAIYRSTSSLKYKKNVKNYAKGLDIVMKLRPVSYEGKNEIDNGKTFAGLIAEEIHELGLTEYVQYAEDGTPDALAYQNMIALAFKAIQEQQAQIEELKALIAAK